MIFACKKHKVAVASKFVFERYPDIKITQSYYNGKLVEDHE